MPASCTVETNPTPVLLCPSLQTLRDGESRARYDHQLSQAELRATVVLHDEIDLEDMEPLLREAPGGVDGDTSGEAAMSYPCRCGDSYVLATQDMQLAGQAQQIIIPCR